jgi:hypothetical protein
MNITLMTPTAMFATDNSSLLLASSVVAARHIPGVRIPASTKL